jgi:hypothetical protein
VDWTAVPFDAGEAGMLTVTEARERMAATEPVDGTTFWTQESETSVVYGKGWAEVAPVDPAPVWVHLGGDRVFQLTRQAAQMLGSTAKANKKYQEFIPPEKLSDLVTWALREGLPESELKLLTSGTGLSEDGTEVPLAVGQCRATIVPFSNVRLLDIALLTARKKFGDEAAAGAVVDYKFFHDREHTSFRLVLPAVQQVIIGTGTEDDAWCYGIEVSNSQTGLKQTELAGYMFRLSTTAGITDVERAAGGFNRRGSLPEDVYSWAADSAQEIFDGPEAAFHGLQVLPEHEMDRDYSSVLAQLFKESPVAKDLKLRIIDDLEAGPEGLTMFDLAHAAAQAANLNGSSWREVRSLHDLAGHMVHQGGGMCDGSLPEGCRRLLPEDWEAPEAS